MKEIVKNTKQQFFAYRNGIVADYLRKAGDPHKVIFGLNLPQIMQIGAMLGKNKDLATAFWTDENGCRESRLLAPMLMPGEEFTIDEALQWCQSVECIEVADVLCHRLLRNTSYANQLAQNLMTSSNVMMQYLALRLWANLLAIEKVADKAELWQIAQQYACNDALASVVSVIKDYCETE